MKGLTRSSPCGLKKSALAAVELYLKTAEGINPDATTPAAPHMARLAKTENGEVTVETIKSDAPPMLTGGPMSDAAK